MAIIITQQGYKNLTEELHRIIRDERPIAYKMLEETRPIGVSDEFPPEYMQALDYQNRVEKRINDLQEVLQDCRIFEKTMIKDTAVIGFGATVSYVDINTDKSFKYTIVSVYESNIENGLIAVQAPLVKEMLGLMVGDTFEFNNSEYEITDIDYFL